MKIELSEKEINELYSLHVLENDPTQEPSRKQFIKTIYEKVKQQKEMKK